MNAQPLRVGIGGPVGSGKPAPTHLHSQALRDRNDIAADTNDIAFRAIWPVPDSLYDDAWHEVATSPLSPRVSAGTVWTGEADGFGFFSSTSYTTERLVLPDSVLRRIGFAGE